MFGIENGRPGKLGFSTSDENPNQFACSRSVAQLDIARTFKAVGRGFESLRDHQVFLLNLLAVSTVSSHSRKYPAQRQLVGIQQMGACCQDWVREILPAEGPLWNS